MDSMMVHAAQRRSFLLLLISYLGFISLGLPDTVTGIAWPGVRDAFAQPQSGLGFISVAFGIGYFLSSFFSGKLTQLLGIGTLLAVSTLLVAAALLGNALAPAWLVFIACGAVWGLGSGAIDAGLNSFAASHFSTRHVNWLHACYSLGATLGPLLMTAAIVRAGSWRVGYGSIAAIVLALGIGFLLTRRLWNDPASAHAAVAIPSATMRDTLRQPLVWLQIVVFFLYTGLEFMVGHWCFTLLTESRGFSVETAGLIASGYFGAILCGRIALGAVADKVGVDRLVRISLAAAAAGAALFAQPSWPLLSIVGLALLGLGLAPIFPCLMSRTPARLGRGLAAHAVGFQVSAATIGAATWPALAGLIAERTSLEAISVLGVVLAATLAALHEVLLIVGRRPIITAAG
jgi:fucose permease